MRKHVRHYRRRDGTFVRSYKRRVTRTSHKAVDGDTIYVQRKVNNSNYIRLQGYNSPERGHPLYNKEKRKLGNLIRDRRIYVEPVAMNQGRVIARVKAGRRDLTKEMKRLRKRR